MKDRPQVKTRKLVVVGLGLIGGSLAVGAKRRGLCEQVLGVARRIEVCEKAVSLGVVDRAAVSLADFALELGEGDVIFIAVPTLTVASVLEEIHRQISPGVTVTDGASVKGSVAADVARIWGEMPANVVLGHPIAGSEKSGVEAANPDLYENHRVIITPHATVGDDHLDRVTRLWRGVGAEVLHLSIADHDEILAATSHLPHVIAYSLVDTLAHDSQNQNIFRYAAGGFRDFTRIASSDVVMWRDIMLANQQAIVHAIDLFSGNLAVLRQAIVEGDAKALTGVFSRAKAARDHFTKMLAQKAYSEPLSGDATYRFAVSGPITGRVNVPGDKSISLRAVVLAAIADGVSRISGFAESEHTLAAIQAFRDLGVVIEGPDHGRVTVYGVGLHGLNPPSGSLYLGNSSVSMRLLTGLLAAQPFASELTGDRDLNRQSIRPVLQPLRQMGAKIECTAAGTPPLTISGGQPLKAMDHVLPVASAPVKSALLLAALYCAGTTRVSEPAGARDHTERMLGSFGVTVQRSAGVTQLEGGQNPKATDLDVPGDYTAALFLMCGVALVPSSELTIERVGVNPTRIASVECLRKFGPQVEFLALGELGGEPVADIRISHRPLTGARFDATQLLDLQDEFPMILVVACFAEGDSVFGGAGRVFAKNSERLQRLLDGLRTLGARCTLAGDDLVIQSGITKTAELDSFGDYRLALAYGLAGLGLNESILVRNSASLTNAFPGFAVMAERAGISLDLFNS